MNKIDLSERTSGSDWHHPMSVLDEVVHDLRFLPYWGWHDDHKNFVGTSHYLPAMQQNRIEFHALADALKQRGLNQRCLQLGLGYSGAAHMVFKTMFDEVWTVECAGDRVKRLVNSCGRIENIIVGNTHDPKTLTRVTSVISKGLDLLFIDAAHKLVDVRQDFYDYAPLVRSGGVIALHDALDRNGHEVHKFVEMLRSEGENISIIGDELGIALVQVA